MDFTNCLAVIIVIFEGVIIQCEGAGDETSLNCEQGTSISDIKEDMPFLPNDLIEKILGLSDFRTIQNIITSKILRTTDIAMSRILQNHIIQIVSFEEMTEIFEYHLYDDIYLRIHTYSKLVPFFNRFGDQVKKIQIGYSSLSKDVPHKQINENIIKKYVKKLEWLRIEHQGDGGFWEETSNGENYIIFPEVKTFETLGHSTRNKFDLSLIFPKLESLKLLENVADVNCLANVKGLKELRLWNSLIQEHQLEDIFANNENMISISLSKLNRSETMRSIAKYLTKLETLRIHYPGEDFLLRANDSKLYELPSVKHFDIVFNDLDEVFGIGNFLFVMPELKKLTLNGYKSDGRIINFIKYFKTLETVELFLSEFNHEKCIEKLQHIKEIKMSREISTKSLKTLFECFDKESKLRILEFQTYNQTLYQTYKGAMEEINTSLQNSMKPTWTLSPEKHIGTIRNYLVFTRKP